MRAKILSALEAAFALGVGVVLIPLLKPMLPFLPLWSWQLISVGIVYVVVAVISLLAWQRPVVTVVWRLAEQGTPPLQDLLVHLDRATLASARYQVSFSGRPKGFITERLMAWLRRRGLRLQFEPQGALAYVVLGRTSREPNGQPLGSTDYGDGFQMRVETVPRQETWMIADLNFQGRELMNQQSFAAVHDATADGKFAAKLANKLILVKSETKKITFY